MTKRQKEEEIKRPLNNKAIRPQYHKTIQAYVYNVKYKKLKQ
jgi:hypothetical protein